MISDEEFDDVEGEREVLGSEIERIRQALGGDEGSEDESESEEDSSDEGENEDFIESSSYKLQGSKSSSKLNTPLYDISTAAGSDVFIPRRAQQSDVSSSQADLQASSVDIPNTGDSDSYHLTELHPVSHINSYTRSNHHDIRHPVIDLTDDNQPTSNIGHNNNNEGHVTAYQSNAVQSSTSHFTDNDTNFSPVDLSPISSLPVSPHEIEVASSSNHGMYHSSSRLVDRAMDDPDGSSEEENDAYDPPYVPELAYDSDDQLDVTSMDTKEALMLSLQINKDYQAQIIEELKQIELALVENRERQLGLTRVKLSHDQETNHPLPSLTKFSKPYFRDAEGRGPPDNEDSQHNKRHANILAYETPTRPWNRKEKVALGQGVRMLNLKNKLDPLVKRLNALGKTEVVEARRLKEKIRKTKELLQSDPKSLEQDLMHIEWDELASKYVPRRSAIDCQLQWSHFGHPRVNLKPWTKYEDKMLLQQANFNFSWNLIAQSLQTNRTPIQCFQRYQRSLNRKLLRSKWTPEEDKQLIELVKMFGEGNWQKVASYMEGRMGEQVMHRYMKACKPTKKGKWSPEENEILLKAVEQNKDLNWERISELVPGRTGTQCRERYVNVLNPSLVRGAWTEEEDQQLLAGVEKHGEGCWAKISKDLRSRTDNQCWRRWISLRKVDYLHYRFNTLRKKREMPANFVGRKKDRPTLGPQDLDIQDVEIKIPVMGRPIKKERPEPKVISKVEDGESETKTSILRKRRQPQGGQIRHPSAVPAKKKAKKLGVRNENKTDEDTNAVPASVGKDATTPCTVPAPLPVKRKTKGVLKENKRHRKIKRRARVSSDDEWEEDHLRSSVTGLQQRKSQRVRKPITFQEDVESDDGLFDDVLDDLNDSSGKRSPTKPKDKEKPGRPRKKTLQIKQERIDSGYPSSACAPKTASGQKGIKVDGQLSAFSLLLQAFHVNVPAVLLNMNARASQTSQAPAAIPSVAGKDQQNASGSLAPASTNNQEELSTLPKQSTEDQQEQATTPPINATSDSLRPASTNSQDETATVPRQSTESKQKQATIPLINASDSLPPAIANSQEETATVSRQHTEDKQDKATTPPAKASDSLTPAPENSQEETVTVHRQSTEDKQEQVTAPPINASNSLTPATASNQDETATLPRQHTDVRQEQAITNTSDSLAPAPPNSLAETATVPRQRTKDQQKQATAPLINASDSLTPAPANNQEELATVPRQHTEDKQDRATTQQDAFVPASQDAPQEVATANRQGSGNVNNTPTIPISTAEHSQQEADPEPKRSVDNQGEALQTGETESNTARSVVASTNYSTQTTFNETSTPVGNTAGKLIQSDGTKTTSTKATIRGASLQIILNKLNEKEYTPCDKRADSVQHSDTIRSSPSKHSPRKAVAPRRTRSKATLSEGPEEVRQCVSNVIVPQHESPGRPKSQSTANAVDKVLLTQRIENMLAKNDDLLVRTIPPRYGRSGFIKAKYGVSRSTFNPPVDPEYSRLEKDLASVTRAEAVAKRPFIPPLPPCLTTLHGFKRLLDAKEQLQNRAKQLYKQQGGVNMSCQSGQSMSATSDAWNNERRQLSASEPKSARKGRADLSSRQQRDSREGVMGDTGHPERADTSVADAISIHPVIGVVNEQNESECTKSVNNLGSVHKDRSNNKGKGNRNPESEDLTSGKEQEVSSAKNISDEEKEASKTIPVEEDETTSRESSTITTNTSITGDVSSEGAPPSSNENDPEVIIPKPQQHKEADPCVKNCLYRNTPSYKLLAARFNSLFLWPMLLDRIPLKGPVPKDLFKVPGQQSWTTGYTMRTSAGPTPVTRDYPVASTSTCGLPSAGMGEHRASSVRGVSQSQRVGDNKGKRLNVPSKSHRIKLGASQKRLQTPGKRKTLTSPQRNVGTPKINENPPALPTRSSKRVTKKISYESLLASSDEDSGEDVSFSGTENDEDEAEEDNPELRTARNTGKRKTLQVKPHEQTAHVKKVKTSVTQTLTQQQQHVIPFVAEDAAKNSGKGRALQVNKPQKQTTQVKKSKTSITPNLARQQHVIPCVAEDAAKNNGKGKALQINKPHKQTAQDKKSKCSVAPTLTQLKRVIPPVGGAEEDNPELRTAKNGKRKALQINKPQEQTAQVKRSKTSVTPNLARQQRVIPSMAEDAAKNNGKGKVLQVNKPPKQTAQVKRSKTSVTPTLTQQRVIPTVVGAGKDDPELRTAKNTCKRKMMHVNKPREQTAQVKKPKTSVTPTLTQQKRAKPPVDKHGKAPEGMYSLNAIIKELSHRKSRK